ncbi:MAG TPA: hypothetical protein VMW17_00495 [Candidatus Binatia bacterium]|nr:hypothetical protein [Candidatus Binatia bacterium]
MQVIEIVAHCPLAGSQLFTSHLLTGVGHTTGIAVQIESEGPRGMTIVLQTPALTHRPSNGYVHEVPSATGLPVHCPPMHWSEVVHGLPSSHVRPLATGTAMHEPLGSHRPAMHGLPVSHDC